MDREEEDSEVDRDVNSDDEFLITDSEDEGTNEEEEMTCVIRKTSMWYVWNVLRQRRCGVRLPDPWAHFRRKDLDRERESDRTFSSNIPKQQALSKV